MYLMKDLRIAIGNFDMRVLTTVRMDIQYFGNHK